MRTRLWSWDGKPHSGLGLRHHAALGKSPGHSKLQAPRLRKDLQKSQEFDVFFLVTLP